jgi:signal transduction histidine kinase
LARQASDIIEHAETDAALVEAVRLSEQVVGILSHDLQTPLSSISISAGALKRKGNVDPKPVDQILASTRRMSGMIAQLLDLTGIRLGGGIPVEPRPSDLSAVISGVVDEVRAAYPERTVDWKTPGPLLGSWDADRMGQVASNLIGNALEHGDSSKRVQVELTLTSEIVALSVHNDGPPIPSDLLPGIFDPYRRGATAEVKTRGLGLGLYITQQIVAAHGGTIDVRSSNEQGTNFVVKLPLGREGH